MIDSIEMDEQEIPRNARPSFCDNPTVSPIEYSRNSSLIANKSYTFNLSYDNMAREEINEKECLNVKTLNTSQDLILDSKFIELSDKSDLSCDTSFDDIHFSFDDEEFKVNNHPFNFNCNESEESCLDKRVSVDPAEDMGDSFHTNEEQKYLCERKSQKILYREAKRRMTMDRQPTHIIDDSIIRYTTDDEETNDLFFDSFSIHEGIILSPIAHEMSQINGKELKDVSNLFPCDISSFAE